MPRKVELLTLRTPPPLRYYKMHKSLSKVFQAKLVTGTILPTIHLSMSIGTVLTYANLFAKSTIKRYPAIIDINAVSSCRLRITKESAIDFRTPLAYEMSWLGHRNLTLIAATAEKCLENVGLVIAASHPMANYCKSKGAKNVIVIPNYPLRDFKTTVDANVWKLRHGIQPSSRIVLFTGGQRVKEIYGPKLLLESWKIVENQLNNVVLVILGDDSIDYIKDQAKSLKIKQLVLPGWLGVKGLANWVNCAEVCVAPRTPGFSDVYYNHEDSTKIPEYAAFGKPIVANSYVPSNQYYLVKSNSSSFAEGILKGLDGKIEPSKPNFWEENEEMLLNILSNFWFNK